MKRIVLLEEESQRVPFNVPDDPVVFCKEMLGFKPTEYQARFLHDQSQFIAACWARQSGKSYIVSALLLYLSLRNPNYNIIVVAPSVRQSKIVVQRVESFLKLLPKSLAPEILKTRIEFHNGSRIQALPNSPETIRGLSAVNFVYIDEMNYLQDDEALYDAVIYTVTTTNGRFLGTSTPGTTDSIFYKMFHNDEAFGDVSRSHVTYLDALEPNGPLKPEILAKLRRQFKGDSPRWTREMMADWTDEDDVFIPMELIMRGVDRELEYIPDSLLGLSEKHERDRSNSRVDPESSTVIPESSPVFDRAMSGNLDSQNQKSFNSSSSEQNKPKTGDFGEGPV